MANVTDLTGSQNTAEDNKSVQIAQDSNVNVFEFGNLILADILPTLIWLINYIADLGGTAVSADDSAGSSVSDDDNTVSNSIAYDDISTLYDATNVNYDGYALQGVVVDMSGS